ncbi:Metallo-dependent phosphatase-like protein [Irpex rosettiformis]|uniref:Metallo-dependent phosphatase-like protein n=1 Tax=Irpex rosettiformis TaxID=378272 RepID=A0ACB8U9Q5_9APHY|nr:Metallo-dependent phosphatase-like protein [Irpex rosettiformis]
MQLAHRLAPLLALLALVAACPGEHNHDHDHVHFKREFPSAPLTPPSRPLVWGDVNIIHTTDSHGWLLGHQKASFPEPNYSGDFGDFASFVAHMKEIALKKDVDLLLIDSGDLHDGTGITDGFPAGGVDAHDANKFIAELPYDIMAIGNHELYIYNNTLDMYKNFAPKLHGRYLSSNVNITVPDKHGNLVSVPVGERFRKFKTNKGRKVTSLGVLFDFTGNDKNTTVQKVEDMVKEAWFAEAIKEEPDFFLLVGHMPVQKDKWPVVFDAVRAVHPYTPILILGGHTHIRDCVQLDGRSMSLESGRYMETVGWMSVDLDKHQTHSSTPKNLTFTRRYLDPNRITFEYHTGRENVTFDTASGKSITKGLEELAKRFDLDFEFGTAPHDYYIDRAPYPSNNSLLTLFASQALPIALKINNTRASIPAFFVTNSGSQRFDVYGGPFTKNDQLTASPFADTFLYIANVTSGVAQKVFATLNSNGSNNRKRDLMEREKRYKRGEVDMVYRDWLREMGSREGAVERRDAGNATLGYVTSDSCPGIGDDTLHAPLPFFDTPDFISSSPPANTTDDTPIDFVFVDFIETQLLQVLNQVQTVKSYASADVLPYTSVLASEALGLFAQQAWN